MPHTLTQRQLEADFDGFNGTHEQRALARDLMHGFAQEPKRLPSRWLYDDEGTRLFSRIMDLPEYYPVARESEILRAHSGVIAKALGPTLASVVELGTHSGRQTEILFRALLRVAPKAEYRPLDDLRSLESLQRARDRAPICVAILGSEIGHCERARVLPYLQDLRSKLRAGDHVLIGFDLLKDVQRMTRAYSDASGLTRAFHMNLLYRLNRELGGDLNLASFNHEACFNPWSRAMESWLISRRDQVVNFGKLGWSVRVKKWEPIQTEISLKFEIEEIDHLGKEAGFDSVARFHDAHFDFCDALWTVSEAASEKSLH